MTTISIKQIFVLIFLGLLLFADLKLVKKNIKKTVQNANLYFKAKDRKKGT